MLKNSEGFRVWNTYPLNSQPFLFICLGMFLLAGLFLYFYRSSYKRLLIAIGTVFALFYMMFIWNLAVNLFDTVGSKVFYAYLVFTATAQALMSLGQQIKEVPIRWAGWFFLFFTLTHLLFVNIWLVDASYKILLLVMVGGTIFFNRDMFPSFNTKQK